MTCHPGPSSFRTPASPIAFASSPMVFPSTGCTTSAAISASGRGRTRGRPCAGAGRRAPRFRRHVVVQQDVDVDRPRAVALRSGRRPISSSMPWRKRRSGSGSKPASIRGGVVVRRLAGRFRVRFVERRHVDDPARSASSCRAPSACSPRGCPGSSPAPGRPWPSVASVPGIANVSRAFASSSPSPPPRLHLAEREMLARCA